MSSILPLLLAALLAVGPADEVAEAEVKAAFLVNFAKFVEWPQSAFQSPGSPLVLTIVDDDPVADALERLVRGKSIENRQVVIRRETGTGNISRSQLVFWGGREANTAHPEYIQGPVLTIGGSQQFLDRGGAVVLLVESSKVRFEVNAGSIQEKGLHVSSRLLALAKRVVKQP